MYVRMIILSNLVYRLLCPYKAMPRKSLQQVLSMDVIYYLCSTVLKLLLFWSFALSVKIELVFIQGKLICMAICDF